MPEDGWELKDMARQAPPEGRDGPRDKEECRGCERLFHPCFENKRDHLTGNLGRRAPN